VKLRFSMLTVVLFLAGCTGTSQVGLDKTQKMLSRSPELRRDANIVCIENISQTSRARREAMASFMNVSLTRVPSTFCRRVLGALAAGRIKQSDVDAAVRGEATPTVVRVLKG